MEIKENIDAIVMKSRQAAHDFLGFDNVRVDEIFKEVALSIAQHRLQLAQDAVNETGRGVIEDKAIKNLFASENIYSAFKNWRVSSSNATSTFMSTAPYGVIAAILPVTNPTSTAIYKALLALRTQNSIILLPHPSARQCTTRTVQLLAEAAVRAGAPENVISVIPDPTREDVVAVMEKCDLIWATGGAEMCRAAAQAGKPALLGGPGNCPAFIDEKSDVEAAVSAIISSKTFDHGMVCATEQAVVVHKAIEEKVRDSLLAHGAYLLSQEETARLASAMRADGGHMINKNMVGKSALEIANLADIRLDNPATRVLVGEANPKNIGPLDPWSCEKMSPILGYYVCNSFDEGVEICARLVKNGGVGHVASLHTEPGWQEFAKGNANFDRVWEFQSKIPAGEVLVNTPSAQGVIGDVFNFESVPRLSVQTNRAPGTPTEISPSSLLRVREVSRRQHHHLWIRLPQVILFEEGSAKKAIEVAFENLTYEQRKAVIISDDTMYRLQVVSRFEGYLKDLSVRSSRFCDVEPDPSFSTVLKGLEVIRKVNPSAIIAIGGGSVMDAAKLMRLMFDHPDATDLDALEARFMDITKRVRPYNELDQKNRSQTETKLVCIPTTSGTGSEVSPFAVITDPRNGSKYPLADYIMTPTITAVDASLVKTLPETQIAAPGIDAMTHAIESYVSVLASNFTKPWSLYACKLLFDNLVASRDGDMKARGAVHEAATLAGMALANAFVGLAHSMAHQLGARFHLHHGVACAIALPHVILYNTNPKGKQAYFPQHRSLIDTKEHYALLARATGCGESAHDLVEAFRKLAKGLSVPLCVREACGVTEGEYKKVIPEMAVSAFDDQCTGTNPRYPLIQEIEKLFAAMW